MIAIKDAKVFTVTQGTLEKGTVLIENGKITAVGQDVVIPAGAQVIDGAGQWLTPGFIEPHGHPNMSDEPNWLPAPSDINELTTPITAHVRILDSFDPAHRAFGEMRRGGFTAVCALPGSGNLIGGMGLSLKNHKTDIVSDMVIEGSTQMKMALGENPRRVYREQKKLPSTRMGNAGLLRETLYNAKVYSDQLKQAETDPTKAPKPDFKLEALVPVVRGEMRCRIHAHRADDIQTAVRIAEEFGLDIAIEHTSDGRRIAGWLAEKKVKCCVGPLNVGPLKQEVWNLSKDTPAVLDAAGVEFSLSHDTGSNTRDLPMYIGVCIARHGLKFDSALKAMTLNPANVLGLADRMGSIEVGKDADLALWTGDPFNNATVCTTTVIDGVVYND